ncbi:hypothetical protein PRIPAC_96585 [Pristionchus pacificus]|uniref:Uncharacterized protein n=1 Tax=Pristionchus pacificus TaxID=54126 RepID=A0A2A6D233_PRIPA|nr:hypothetical protein PRIPAC_96585 [Pristionchus pacificus]|eukprot:PDM84367.1 hypothetical protein PRIPAC_33390 [Pristionchus pacificus]
MSCWLTIGSIPKLLFLLLPILLCAADFRAADLDSKSAVELEEYRRLLSNELDRIAQKVEAKRADSTTGKSEKRTLPSPLSASIPNRESTYVLERMRSLSSKEQENSILEDEGLEPVRKETKEPRIEEKLITLLNSLDDYSLDNSTVEGSGETADESTTSEPILTKEHSTTTPISIVETTTQNSTESTYNSTELLTSDGEHTTSLPMSTSTTIPPEKAPRRSPAHGVIISVASPHSPSLSPILSNFSSMSKMRMMSATTVDTSLNTKRASEEAMEGLAKREERREQPASPRRVAFNPTVNHTREECRRLTQHELLRELKQQGTYNPDLMAWDVFGILRFLDRTIAEQCRNHTRGVDAVERNIDALSRILGELDVSCDIRSDIVRQRMQNMSMIEPRRTVLSPNIRRRSKRDVVLGELSRLMANLEESKMRSTTTSRPTTTTSAPFYETVGNRQKLIGESHVVPFGCDRRGTEEDGYLRLCSACQSIRRLPDSFFPPFINEVTCDEDNACLYFYDYPHGRCKQKHMNFVVLRNIGTEECQVWQKFNLNVRVSCECFVDEMSFFAKYV